ncbi:MAG TPA: FAD-dependent oxidoreductase [Thermoplasmata archaeon]|nr:FAD-dependent oxidoreductase [Thermoplasmata archaeon]
MERFDVVVVGAGLAGCAAAYTAAREGLQVVLAERGSQPGTKTVSGGLLYTHVLGRMFPKFWEEEPSPVERAIDRNVVSLLTPTRAASLDYFDADFSRPPFNAFSVLRSRLDPWLAGKAEAAGAVPVYGIKIDALVREDSRVVGIRAGGDEIRAGVVVLAEGSNSILSRGDPQKPPPDAKVVGVGVKQVIGLPPGEVERRFQLRGMAGTQYTTVGFPPDIEGGGFLYTNRETLSLGLILGMDSLVRKGASMFEVLEEYKQHPLISRLLDGGTLLEYSGCFVEEGGYDRLPPLFGDGYLVAGSAAGFFLNTGFTLRGMDFALESGRLAGEAAVRAVRAKDPSGTTLASYRSALEQSFVLKELRAFRGSPGVFHNPRIYGAYPEILTTMMHGAFFTDGGGRPHLRKLLSASYRGRASLFRLARDAMKISSTL